MQEREQEQQRQTPDRGLSLILYRLESIEENTRQMVPKNLYTLEQSQIQGRVKVLELERDEEKRSRKQILAAVLVALVAPAAVALPVVLRALGV